MLAPSPNLGHNRPPGPLEQAKEATVELNSWLTENPVVQDQQTAKSGAAYIERSRVALQEMESERVEKVRPLNDELRLLNGLYRGVREPLEKFVAILKKRLTDYATVEEERRRAILAEAQRIAAETERLAREAEAAEKAAMDNAAAGECVDVGAATVEADAAFHDYQVAGRQAARIARQVPVRLGSIMGGRALSMRTQETLIVTDAAAAIAAIGLTENIAEAICTSARKYRDEYGELPPGIESKKERTI